MTGTQWSGLAWRAASAEVNVHVSSHFFALNDRRDRQTELRIAAPWKSTTSIKQQKKEERLHSKRSPCKNRDGKFLQQNEVKSMYVVALHCWRWVSPRNVFKNVRFTSTPSFNHSCSQISVISDAQPHTAAQSLPRTHGFAHDQLLDGSWRGRSSSALPLRRTLAVTVVSDTRTVICQRHAVWPSENATLVLFAHAHYVKLRMRIHHI